MALRVAWDCVATDGHGCASIFCSRYGEFTRSFEILQTLARNEPVSPMSFSQSVHNASAGLFAIARRDRAPSSALAAGTETLEAAFVEAWSMLTIGEVPAVLVVYVDEPLPRLYAEQPTTVGRAAAFAMLLTRPESGRTSGRLRLAWRVADGEATREPMRDPAPRLLRLLLAGGEPVTIASYRLVWTWSRHGCPV